MVRPIKRAKVVYRVVVDRPKMKDSVVRWTSASIEEIRERYGDKILSVSEYDYVGEVRDTW